MRAWVRGFGTVIGRETIRTARQRRTWVQRSVFSLASFLLFFTVYAVLLSQQQANPAVLGTAGYWLVEGALAAMGFGLLMLVPASTASGLIEEREGRTLDLLILTPLVVGQVVLGKLASRLAASWTVLAGVVPLLALAATFGGVDPHRLGQALVSMLVMSLLLGLMALALAIRARSSVLAPVLLTWIWAFAAFALIPMWDVYLTNAAPDALGELSPLWMAWSDQWSTIGWMMAAWAPVVVGLLRYCSVRTTNVAMEDGPDVWFRRFRASTQVILVIWVVLLLPTGGLIDWLNGIEQDWASWLWCTSTLYVGTAAYLLAGQRLVHWIGKPRRRVGSKPAVRISINPVTWRLLRGGEGQWIVWMMLGIQALTVTSYVYTSDGRLFAKDTILLVMSATVLAWALALMLGVQGVLKERQARTLPVLLTTTMSGGAIVRGGLWMQLSYAAPLLASGALFVGFVEPRWAPLWMGLYFGWALAGAAVWAMLGAAAATFFRTPGTSWTFAFGTFAVYWVGGPIVTILVSEVASTTAANWWMSAWLPLVDGPSGWFGLMLPATFVYTAAVLVAIPLVGRRLRAVYADR
jgi:ABC-type transport system involved in multi-copper enzyme maturation permease subunit